jgi:hypothetical protein
LGAIFAAMLETFLLAKRVFGIMGRSGFYLKPFLAPISDPVH